MIAYVYVLKNKKGIPFYVGATIRPRARLATHISMIKRLNTYVPPLYYYMRDKKIIPLMDILESKDYINEEELLKAEARWIRRLKRKGIYLINKCYNK